MKDKSKRTVRLYMAVTTDSAAELARLRGIKKRTVFSGICISRKMKYPRYIVVDVEDDDLPF